MPEAGVTPPIQKAADFAFKVLIAAVEQGATAKN